MPFEVGIIIISDRASTGEREDQCIPVFKSLLDSDRFEIAETAIVSDDPADIKTALEKMIANGRHLIFTSGGTGCGPRDNTPEVTRQLLEKPTPGLDEAIRTYSATKSRNAYFSRACSGVVGNSFIVNVPGSPKAVGEILEFIDPIIEHPLKLIARQIKDCTEEENPDAQL
jgi:molybdenum cofactor synthesis domain-containing protein